MDTNTCNAAEWWMIIFSQRSVQEAANMQPALEDLGCRLWHTTRIEDPLGGCFTQCLQVPLPWKQLTCRLAEQSFVLPDCM